MYKSKIFNSKILSVAGVILYGLTLSAQQIQPYGQQAPYPQTRSYDGQQPRWNRQQGQPYGQQGQPYVQQGQFYGQQGQPYGQQGPSNLNQIQSNTPSNTSSETNAETSVSQGEAQKQLEVEKERQLAQEEIRKSIISDAVAVIKETKNAILLINKGRNNEAMGSIERAVGKIDVLLARYPNQALLPIDFYIDVVNTAPLSLDRIKEIANQAQKAVKNTDYPEARYLLDALQSEISIEIYCLPLGIYPIALKKAASLLAQRANQESRRLLQEALDSLVVVDQTLPIPMIGARTLLAIAEERYQDNKAIASKLLEMARFELERARELGYISKSDADYSALNDTIKDIQKQMDSNNRNPSMFSSLKNRMEAFLKKHFEKKKNSNELTSKSSEN